MTFPGFADFTKGHAVSAPEHLDRLGFMVGENGTHASLADATHRFQEAWNPGPNNQGFGWLTIDGKAGPKTTAALALCVWTGGLLSPHFRAGEMRCRHCGWIKSNRVLLAALEKLRPASGLSIVSGTRCPQHNRDIGGATHSQHIYGTAVDIPPIWTTAQILNRRLFSGVEKRRDGRVYHVDTRHAGAYNPTHSTVTNPSVFLWG